MRIAVFGRKITIEQEPWVKEFFEAIKNDSIQIFVYEALQRHISSFVEETYPTIYTNKDLYQHKIDYVITLGGDGTILAAATLLRDSSIPILGINLGRLGFLASIEKQYISQAIKYLRQKKFTLDKRVLIELDCNIPIFSENPFALNDVSILKRDNSSMIVIHTYVNGDFLNSYWADGLIIATPTGSTAYSLSCGGPIIYPNCGVFVITPVAPHNLNVRPIVLSDDSKITFEIEGRADNFLCTLDSRYEIITEKHKIHIKKTDYQIHLIQLEERSFAKTVRDKLMWGHDTRQHFKN